MRTLPIRLACGRETGRRRRLAATFRAREAAQAPALEPFSRCSPRVRKQIHRRALWTPHRRRRGRLSQQTLSEQSVIDRCRPGWSRRRWSGSLTPTPAGSYGMASDKRISNQLLAGRLDRGGDRRARRRAREADQAAGGAGEAECVVGVEQWAEIRRLVSAGRAALAAVGRQVDRGGAGHGCSGVGE